MPKSTVANLDLDVDLQGGVVPISKAASALAALIKRGKERQQPIIVTQKGYPTGVLLPVNLYTALRTLAQRELAQDQGASDAVPTLAPEIDAPAEVAAAVAVLPDLAAHSAPDEPADEAAPLAVPAPRRGRGGRRSKGAGQDEG